MCNLYSLTKGQAAIRDWFRASNDRTGNLPLLPGIFPDQMAPIVRNGADGERELVMARWGMPGPPQFGGAPITNIRNVGSPHWRGWLGKQNRCIVPATSFCEYADTKPRKTPKWFALSQDRPLFAFAGLWTPWRGVRGPKSAAIDGQHELFGFLTTEANAVVAPIHPKAMPVILTTPAEVDLWLLADAPKALELQRPLLDDLLRIVASGEKEDGARQDAAPTRDRGPTLPWRRGGGSASSWPDGCHLLGLHAGSLILSRSELPLLGAHSSRSDRSAPCGARIETIRAAIR
jgi:putative SOS response-associated peptidase YedK